MQKKIWLFIDIVLAALLVIADRKTKLWAVSSLSDGTDIVLIDSVLQLTYVENNGAAFGLMQNARYFFIIVAVIIMLLIAFFLLRAPADAKYRPLRLVLVFIAAGAAGNMIDRLTTVYVVDFIYFSLINFPVFNVADMYVTVSTLFLAILLLVHYKEADFAFLKKSGVTQKDVQD